MTEEENDYILPPEWINEQFIYQALKIHNQFTKFNVASAVKKGDCYGSQLFRVRATYQTEEKAVEELSVIIKILPSKENIKKIVRNAKFFIIEGQMLGETLPLIQSILDQINFPQIFPKMLYCESSPNEVLVMEDLQKLGFSNSDRIEGLDLQHMTLVIEALAALHAASIKASVIKPELKNIFKKTFCNKSERDSSLLKSLDFLGLACVQWKDMSVDLLERLKNLKENILKDYHNAIEPNNEQFQVLNHGDPWVTNCMFKYYDDRPIEVKLIDFQCSHFNSPLYDLILMIFTSAKEYVIVHHIDYLLERYHQKLIEICQNIDCNLNFTLEDLKATYKKKLIFAFTTSISYIPLDRASRSKRLNLDNTLDGEISEAAELSLYQSPLFESYMRAMLPLFMENGVL